jgi:hypothetical protein
MTGAWPRKAQQPKGKDYLFSFEAIRLTFV